jgi:hypothetical protein
MPDTYRQSGQSIVAWPLYGRHNLANHRPQPLYLITSLRGTLPRLRSETECKVFITAALDQRPQDWLLEGTPGITLNVIYGSACRRRTCDHGDVGTRYASAYCAVPLTRAST